MTDVRHVPMSERPRRAYSLVFWGAVLLTLEFRVDHGPDLLLDPVGAALFWVGAGRLAYRTSGFLVARNVALVMGVLWWPLVENPAGMAELLHLVLRLGFHWSLLDAVAHDSRKRGWFHDGARAVRLRDGGLVLFLLLVAALLTKSSLLEAVVVLGKIAWGITALVLASEVSRRSELRGPQRARPALIPAHGEPT